MTKNLGLLEDGSFLREPGCIEGTLITRTFPDGTITGLRCMAFSAVELFLTPAHNHAVIDEVYTFQTMRSALAALMAWTPGNEEPEGWIRHRPSNRRRENGNAALEEVRP